MTQTDAKSRIGKLVEKYIRLSNENKIKTYNEAQTRNEFIEPLFEALGWDMRNLENSNEVTTEENVSGGRVDLAFRINEIPAFLLEAKAMKVDLDEWKWAEQAINYSWNKSVSWAILTDFEAIKIFNSEIPPKGINENLFIEIKWDEYLTRFDQLWLLSKDSFQAGLLAKEAEKWGKITKRKDVGEKLFEDLTMWRSLLTSNIKKNNRVPDVEIDEGVQKILDRLIFIRTAEDRKIDAIILQPLLREFENSNRNLFRELAKAFRDFDDNYNSKLFAEHPSEQFTIDNKPLCTVLNGLYQTQDGFRYDFSLISADVLGGIYEQYLSYVLEKSKRNLVITEKEKKKKTQGIFYTPRYVVNYIVKETLGKKLSELKPKDIQRLTLLDPASGSGSFLIAAFDHLLHSLESRTGERSLFSRFEILKDNIFGVDLDVQAVEISQLNLLLKVLTRKEKLPSLSHNIRVGNSLLEAGDLDAKPFDYKKEFPEVFGNKGFDVIMGNPPYIKEFTNKSAFDGLHENPYYQGKMDIWTLFACKAIDLLKEGGLLGFIAPNNWLTNAGASIFRNKILTDGEIREYVDFGDYKIFKKAGIQTMIFIFEKRKPRSSYKVKYAKIIDKNIEEAKVIQLLNSGLKFRAPGIVGFNTSIKYKELIDENISFVDETASSVLAQIDSARSFELAESEVAQGIVGDPDDAFNFAQDGKYTSKERSLLYDYYTSVERYASGTIRGLIAYLNKSITDIGEYPNIKKQLDTFAPKLKKRREVLNGRIKYFHLHWPRDEKFFQKGPKIVCAIRTPHPAFFYTEDKYYGSRALNFIKTDRLNLKVLTGILNSKVSYYWLKNKGKQLGDLLQVDKGPLLNIPIPKIEAKLENQIIDLVDYITSASAERAQFTLNTDHYNRISDAISKAEKKLDLIIFDAYKLDSEAKEIIRDFL